MKTKPVDVMAGPFDGTEGYQAMWIVCGGTVLASLWFVRKMKRVYEDGVSGAT